MSEKEKENINAVVNKLIGGNETDILRDMLETTNFKLYSNGDGTYQIYDAVNKEVYAESVSTASGAIDALDIYVKDNILEYLEHEAYIKGISDIPTTCSEWKESITRPDLQEFIEENRSDIAKVLLIADPDRADKKIDMEGISEELANDRDMSDKDMNE